MLSRVKYLYGTYIIYETRVIEENQYVGVIHARYLLLYGSWLLR